MTTYMTRPTDAPASVTVGSNSYTADVGGCIAAADTDVSNLLHAGYKKVSSGDTIALIANGTASGNAQAWPGGEGVMSVAGTFNGATVKLQFLGADGTTWLDAGTGATFTAAGAGVFYLPPGQIKAVVSSGPPSGIYASAAKIIR